MAFVNLLSVMYPVRIFYLSSNNTSPATTYGGTWSPLNESRYLRLAGAWGTGGSNTISVDQMPSHRHISSRPEVVENHEAGGTLFGSALTGRWSADDSYGENLYTSYTGSGKAFYPSYRNVYAWYRTA